MVDMPTGHPDDQVIELGYSSAGWQESYSPGDTLQSVGDSSGRLAEIYAAYPDSEFYVIGHSLGGVVALDGLARHSDDTNRMAERTNGVITVSSSVRGIRDSTSGVAGAAIELLVCRQVPGLDGLSPVWSDLQQSSATISLIHDADWSSVRVVNFANSKDRVVSPETALLETHFEIACYDEGRNGVLQLNHDTLLSQQDLARELLSVLIDGDEPRGGCEAG